MVTGPRFGAVALVVTVGLTLAGCLSSANNDYLFSCASGGSCPGATQCASDSLCHPVYTPGAGPSDAGSYICATASPQCPEGQVCSDGLCGAGEGSPDAGDAGPVDAGSDAGPGDAGSTPDAGLDAGGTPDAGGAPDAGPDAGTDAGPSICDLSKAFTAPTSFACGIDCFGLAVGDFNHDGYNDVAVAVDTDVNGAGGVGLFLNEHDATFGLPVTSRVLIPCAGTIADGNGFATPDALAVADLNGDGWLDLGLSLSGSGQLGLAINGQDSGFVIGGFQPLVSPICASDSYPYSSITAFQTNGSSDWYLGAVGYGIEDADDGSIFVYSQVQSNAQGLDAWNTITPAEGTIAYGATVQHFNNSPLASAVLAENDGENLGQVEVFSGTHSGSTVLASSASAVLSCQPGTNSATTSDLNGDGLLDLVAVNTFQNTVSVFYAKDGGFRPAVAFSTVLGDAGGAPVQAAIGDFDGDGHADIATANAAGNITILKGLTDGGFLAVSGVISSLTTPYWISAVDLEDPNVNDGGRQDLVVSSLVNSGGAAVEVYYNACR